MAEKIAESEYSLQYYGFTPEDFFKDFSELILHEMTLHVQHATKEVSSPTCKYLSEESIQELFEMHNEWSQRAEVVLKKLEPIIMNYFTIPKNVLLPVYAGSEKQYTEEEIKKLEEEITELKTKYTQQKAEIAVHKSEIALLDHLGTVDEKVNEAIGVVNRTKEAMDQVKELELLKQSLEDNRSKYFSTNDNDEDDDSERNDLSELHAWKFKTVHLYL